MCQHDPHHRHGAGRRGAALEHGDDHGRDYARWSRRDFLASGALAAGVGFMLGGTPVKAFGTHPLLSLLAELETDRILVLIQLNGGNDGLNTVIPVSNDIYYQKRPVIGIKKQDAFLLNQEVGLNPGLSALEGMWNEGKMSILRNVGYPAPNLSHFRATDIWVTGTDSDVVEDTGWMGRFLDQEYPDYYAQANTYPLAVQIGTNQALLFQGPASGMAMNISSPELFYKLASEGKAYETEGFPDNAFGQEVSWVRSLANQSYTYAGAIQTASAAGANQAEYPSGNSLATNLAIVAKLIKGNLGAKVYMVSLSGFDTHANQISTQETLMRRLAEGVKAFFDDLAFQGLGDKVTAMTFSEFGRRVNENGSSGTDHGTSAPMFLFGGGVSGGLVGNAPNLADLDNSGNLKFEIDYRQVYATLMADWFGVPQASVDQVFGAPFQTLDLVQEPITTGFGENPAVPGEFILRQNYPNPFNPSTQISYTLPQAGMVRLRIVDTAGRLVRTLVDGQQSAGTYEVAFDASELASGVYLYTLEAAGTRMTKKMTLVK